MSNRFVAFLTGDYEADYELVNSDDECSTGYGYEELHLTPELIKELNSGKDIAVHVQDEYILRIKLEVLNG